MFKFQRLVVWQKSIEYSKLISKIIEQIPKRHLYTFGNQLTDAMLSISNNKAEGAGRRSIKESGYFFNVSKASVFETVNIVIVLKETRIMTIDGELEKEIIVRADELCRMLGGLLKKSN